MKVNNSKGFTLVELIATIVVLSLVMGVAGISVVAVINNSKKKELNLLIDNIKDGTETYYQECRYSSSSLIVCPAADSNLYYEITLGDLVEYGFLKGNANDSDDKFILVNPSDKKDISSCKIRYKYDNGSLIYEEVTNSNKSCPEVR